MLERERIVGELRAALEAAQAGIGSTQLMSGPAGIGKSALLTTLRDMAEEDGSLVLSARASEFDHGFAFGIVHQLLEHVMRVADAERRARLFSGAAERAAALFGPAAVEDADPEYGVLSGLYWLVANLADERPLVLRVDDLHWADTASLRFLEFLGRRIEGLRVLVATTIRTGEPGADSELIVALKAAPASETIKPEALSRQAVSEILVGALDATPAESFLDATWRATRGNPLLVTVLAREAAAAGLSGRASESTGLAELAAGGVAPAIGNRLRALPAESVTVARVAAVIGERARREDLVGLCELSSPAVTEALGRLAEVEIVEPGGKWTFKHPLVLAAVAELIPPREREQLHRRAAMLLRERGARPAEIALHWLATGPAADPVAVEDLRRAAAEAVTEGAISTAVDLLRRALDEGAELSDRPQLLLELAELELRTLQPEGPERMQEALDAGLPDEDAARGRAALGKMLILVDPEAGLAEIDAAHATTVDRGLRLRLQASLLEAMVLVDAVSDERDARYQAIRDDPEPSVVELAHLASEEALRGTIPAGEVADLANRAAADTVLLREVGPGGATWNLLTHALRFVERPDEARRLLIEGARVVRRGGMRAAGTFVDQSWGYWHRDFGSAARGLAHAQAGYESILDARLPISAWSLTSIMAENMVLLDRVAEADALLDEPLGAAEHTFVEPFALTARGYVRMMNGRPEEAERDLRRVVEILDEHGWHAPAAARGRMRLAELLAGTGREDEALELTAEDARWAERAGTKGVLGCVLRVRALAQRGDERLATQRRAIGAFAASPLLADRALALAEIGTELRERDELEEAREVLRQALDLASQSEAALLSRQIRGELEAAGARPRRERISGLEALTPRERRVAELAAEGMTNREIAEELWVTHKTVEYHLRNTYSKLKISSRARLATVLGVG